MFSHGIAHPESGYGDSTELAARVASVVFVAKEEEEEEVRVLTLGDVVVTETLGVLVAVCVAEETEDKDKNDDDTLAVPPAELFLVPEFVPDPLEPDPDPEADTNPWIRPCAAPDEDEEDEPLFDAPPPAAAATAADCWLAVDPRDKVLAAEAVVAVSKDAVATVSVADLEMAESEEKREEVLEGTIDEETFEEEKEEEEEGFEEESGDAVGPREDVKVYGIVETRAEEYCEGMTVTVDWGKVVLLVEVTFRVRVVFEKIVTTPGIGNAVLVVWVVFGT